MFPPPKKEWGFGKAWLFVWISEHWSDQNVNTHDSFHTSVLNGDGFSLQEKGPFKWKLKINGLWANFCQPLLLDCPTKGFLPLNLIDSTIKRLHHFLKNIYWFLSLLGKPEDLEKSEVDIRWQQPSRARSISRNQHTSSRPLQFPPHVCLSPSHHAPSHSYYLPGSQRHLNLRSLFSSTLYLSTNQSLPTITAVGTRNAPTQWQWSQKRRWIWMSQEQGQSRWHIPNAYRINLSSFLLFACLHSLFSQKDCLCVFSLNVN